MELSIVQNGEKAAAILAEAAKEDGLCILATAAQFIEAASSRVHQLPFQPFNSVSLFPSRSKASFSESSCKQTKKWRDCSEESSNGSSELSSLTSLWRGAYEAPRLYTLASVACSVRRAPLECVCLNKDSSKVMKKKRSARVARTSTSKLSSLTWISIRNIQIPSNCSSYLSHTTLNKGLPKNAQKASKMKSLPRQNIVMQVNKRHCSGNIKQMDSRLEQCSVAIQKFLCSQTSSCSETHIRRIFGNNPDTSKALRMLLKKQWVIRRGAGGKLDPFLYEANQTNMK